MAKLTSAWQRQIEMVREDAAVTLAAALARLQQAARDLQDLTQETRACLRPPKTRCLGTKRPLLAWPSGQWYELIVGRRQHRVDTLLPSVLAKQIAEQFWTPSQLRAAVRLVERAARWCEARVEGLRRHVENTMRREAAVRRELRDQASFERLARLGEEE